MPLPVISTLAGNDGTGAINGGSVTTLTGSVTEINRTTAMGTDPTNFNSTLSAGSEAASAISTLAGNDGTGD